MGLIISAFKLFCWAAFFIAGLHTLVSYLLLWVERRAALFIQAQADQRPAPPPALWLKCLFQEFTAIFLKCLTYPIACFFPDPLGFLFKGKQVSPKNSQTPVVFVNGYFCAASIWWYLVFQLKKQWLQDPSSENLPMFYYHSPFKNPLAAIPDLAQLLHNQIKKIRTETGAEQVIVVAFSMGGLIASYMSEYLDEEKAIAKVISIGTPFKGSKMATLAMGKNIEQMLPESDFVTALSEKIAQSKTPYYCVATEMDNDVIPWQSAIVSGNVSADRLLVVKDCGHLGLLLSKAVIAKVADWMQS